MNINFSKLEFLILFYKIMWPFVNFCKKNNGGRDTIFQMAEKERLYFHQSSLA